MDMPKEQITEWMKAQINQSLLIRKEELHVIDEIRIRLEDARIEHNPYAEVDEYVSKEALVLQGEGAFVGQEDAPLPDGTYEIALAEPYTIDRVGESVRIKTHRAVYTISTEEPAGQNQVH